MAALCYEKIVAILEQARRIDQKCQLFGASENQYKLNPPLNAAVVRLVEETYHFTFPEDYFQFITQVADGGAEPDYGIMPFEASLRSEAYNDFQEAYKRSLKTPFVPRPMMPEDVERHSFSKDSYERNPDQFLICEKGEDDICGTVFGFWELTDANGILVWSCLVGERDRYSPRTMRELMPLRHTAFMNFIRDGLIGFLIRRISAKN